MQTMHLLAALLLACMFALEWNVTQQLILSAYIRSNDVICVTENEAGEGFSPDYVVCPFQPTGSA